MTWANVKRVFRRELRDQLRDRRTLFTIAVLPILMYPLLGMTMLQVAQFSKEHPTTIYIVGSQHLPAEPALIAEGKFVEKYCPSEEARLLRIAPQQQIPANILKDVDAILNLETASDAEKQKWLRILQKELVRQNVDALIYIPAEFSGLMSGQEKTASQNDASNETLLDPVAPLATHSAETQFANMQVFVNSANDKSRIASERVTKVFERWRSSIVEESLAAKSVTVRETKPFQVEQRDLASDAGRRAAIWSRILPFIVLVWALTGAFYPAIDLCAGEKERGTLETLLCSPAKRSEIVCGKLLTIMSFSIATSLLNLASMAITGLFVINQMSHFGSGSPAFQIGPPPIHALGWLILVLIPIAALFSALSLAVASFARSSKEGQYYLMPLMLVILPLLMLPMLPAAELNLGSSLIPITGVMLLLRSLIEGRYGEVGQFCVPVIGVTTCCCIMAIRWAVNQFNNESVLFRESERFGIGTWLRSLVRDRRALPTYGQAILCGLLILVIRFFGSLIAEMPTTWAGFTRTTLITLIGLIAAPALFMAVLLTKKPLQALNLRKPKLATIPAAMLLAFCIHPAAMGLATLIQQLYPASDDLLKLNEVIQNLLSQAANVYVILLVIALAPAICEELVFRGFILSGLMSRSSNETHKWSAIAVSSLFFAVAHAILQQSLSAFALGLIIGYVAVQSRSIFPCIAYHFVHNSLAIVMSLVPDWSNSFPLLEYVFVMSRNSFGQTTVGYHWPASLLMGGIAILILLWFRKQVPRKSADQPDLISGANPATLAI